MKNVLTKGDVSASSWRVSLQRKRRVIVNDEADEEALASYPDPLVIFDHELREEMMIRNGML